MTRFIGCCLLAALSHPLMAQRDSLRVWALAEPEVRHPQPFDNIRAAVELSDGRLILLDGVPYIVNPAAGTRAPFGRFGDGPGEYRPPLKVFPFRGDTTAYIDGARPGRLLFILPFGRIEGALELPGGFARDLAADQQGRIYLTKYGRSGLGDSIGILRWQRRAEKTDTVARVSSAVIAGVPLRNDPSLPPFATFDQWAVSRDARVAVVSVQPYRVTIFPENGAVVTGPNLPSEAVRLTEAHRRDWLEQAMHPVPALVSADGGPRSAQWVKPRKRDVEPAVWPKVLPPFLPGAVTFAPDGSLWIQRTTSDPASPSIDVIDRRGMLLGRLDLPNRRRFLTHGKETVYLLRVDDDGLQYIERYRLPAGYKEAVSR